MRVRTVTGLTAVLVMVLGMRNAFAALFPYALILGTAAALAGAFVVWATVTYSHPGL
jgi:hypothetical protein